MGVAERISRDLALVRSEEFRALCVLRAWPSMIPRCGGAPFHDAAVLYR
jgi:hypothetical protein